MDHPVIDPEPDEQWKTRIRKQIEDGLRDMHDEAIREKERKLGSGPLSEESRAAVIAEYERSKKHIIELAEGEFQGALMRERQERLLIDKQDPQFLKDQQAMYENIQRSTSYPSGSTTDDSHRSNSTSVSSSIPEYVPDAPTAPRYDTESSNLSDIPESPGTTTDEVEDDSDDGSDGRDYSLTEDSSRPNNIASELRNSPISVAGSRRGSVSSAASVYWCPTQDQPSSNTPVNPNASVSARTNGETAVGRERSVSRGSLRGRGMPASKASNIGSRSLQTADHPLGDQTQGFEVESSRLRAAEKLRGPTLQDTEKDAVTPSLSSSATRTARTVHDTPSPGGDFSQRPPQSTIPNQSPVSPVSPSGHVTQRLRQSGLSATKPSALQSMPVAQNAGFNASRQDLYTSASGQYGAPSPVLQDDGHHVSRQASKTSLRSQNMQYDIFHPRGAPSDLPVGNRPISRKSSLTVEDLNRPTPSGVTNSGRTAYHGASTHSPGQEDSFAESTASWHTRRPNQDTTSSHAYVRDAGVSGSAPINIYGPRPPFARRSSGEEPFITASPVSVNVSPYPPPWVSPTGSPGSFKLPSRVSSRSSLRDVRTDRSIVPGRRTFDVPEASGESDNEDDSAEYDVSFLLEDVRAREEEIKQREDAVRKREEGAWKREEAVKRREKEVQIKEERALRMEEAAQGQEAKTREASEEAQRELDEAHRIADQAWNEVDKAKRKAKEEAAFREQERKHHEEMLQRKDAETRQMQDDLRKRETELQRKEDELKRKEAKMREEEYRLSKERDRQRQNSLGSEGGRTASAAGNWTQWARASSASSAASSDHGSTTSATSSSGSNWSSSTRSSSTTRSTSSSFPSASTTGSGGTSTPRAASSGPTHTTVPPSSTSGQTTSGTSETSGASKARPSPASAHNFHSSTFSEAEWARRQEELAKEQQERFRMEQERIERERQARTARVMTKEQVLELFATHERKWKMLPDLESLTWDSFPWPVFKPPSEPEDITVITVSAYVLSPAVQSDKSDKDRIKEHIKRWHPDRFETKLLPKVREEDQEKVKSGAGVVARALNDLLTRSHVTNVFA